MKTRTHKEQMPARSGRRRGGSEERRGRRPHPSPSRAERNDRPAQRVVEELGCFTRRPHGHDSSESDAERTIPPPKRPKVQDSLSSAPTSAHSTGTTTSASHPTSSNTQSRESDNEDRQSQASRSSAGGSLANSSSSISSGRDIDQDNRSSSPSLSGSPLASLDSESDSPDSPKQGGKAKDGLVAKPGVAPRADDGGSAECRDSEGGMEVNLSPLKSPASLGPLTDGGSARKFFSNDSKMVTKMEFPGSGCDEVLHSRIGVNPKISSQCSGKPTVGGTVEYAHGNPNVSHSPSAALPPPPALKPLEAGQGAPSDIKVEKVEKCEKPQASHLPQSASLPQQAPPSRHPHHYSPNTWSGTSVSSHGNWSYSRYPGVHHPPVQQQQLPSVYNPPSSARHPNHPPYLPHSHSTHTQQPNTQRDYVPRYSGPAERERPGRDFGIKDASASAGATSSATSANPGSDFGTPVPGQTRDFAPPTRDGPSVGREFRPVFRERDTARDFSLQNLNQQHVPQNREFGSGGTSGATGCHTRDKDDRWGDFSGQIRNAGGNNNQSSTSLPASSSQNNSATQNKDFQSSVEPVGPQGPPSQVPSAGSDPPSAGHFLRDYPPQGVKEYPPASGQPSAPHPAPTRDYPSPTGPAGLPPNVGREMLSSGPPGHYMVQPGLSVQSREREREQERENISSSSLYPNRSHPPSLSPSTSSSGHGHQPVPSYPPTSHSQQAPPPSTLPANQARPAQYPLPNQSPSTPLSPLPSPSKNQIGGFPPFSSTSAPASGVATSCISGCRPAPYHGNLNSHAPYPSGYHSSSTHSNTATTSNTNSNSGATSNVQLHSPPPSKIQPHLCSPVAQQPVGLTGAEGQGDQMPCPVPPPVIKEEPIEEREETDSPSTVLRSPSPEPKPIDIPIHASQSARFHRVLDRGSANSCARTDVLFIPLDGSKLWKKRNEAMERARREVEQRARDLREKERERERERDRERERERDLERHLQQKESNSASVPRQGSSLFFPPSSSILLDPSSSSSTPCINPSHQATHHSAHLPHPSHAHSLHPSLAHSIPHSLLLPSVGGLGPYLGPDTPALRTLSEYARPHAMSPLGAPNRAPPHFHPHPHPHPHAHPHMHPSLFLPQFQNPALAHPHHLPADAATAAAILGFLYGSGLEGGHGHPVAGPVAGPGPGGMAGLGASLGGVGFPHAVAAHRERMKSGFDFKSEFDSHTHSHSHSLLLGGGGGGGAPPSDVAIYGTPPPSAPPPPALVAAVAARNPSAIPQPLSTPPASALLPPTLPAHAPPSVNPTAPAPPPPPPAPPPPPPMVSSLHQPSPAPEGYSTPIRTPPSTERARSVERERERERERVLPGAERERTAPAGGGAVSGGSGASGGGGTSGGGGGGGLQMLNVTPHHHQHSHIHSHLHLHQQDTAASGVHPLIDPLTTGAPLPRLPYPGSIITHPLTESDVLRQQLFGGPFRDLPPHSSMHHQNTELQIQRLALEQQWIHHHTHSLTQEEYYSHLKKESDKTL